MAQINSSVVPSDPFWACNLRAILFELHHMFPWENAAIKRHSSTGNNLFVSTLGLQPTIQFHLA